MPWLQQAHDTGEVDVLGVDAEDQAKSAAALLDELDVTFPSVFDPANELAREIGIITKADHAIRVEGRRGRLRPAWAVRLVRPDA